MADTTSKEIITTIIAAYSAIIATFVLGWNVFRDITEKGRLRLHCYIGKILVPHGPPDENDYLVFSVTNIGRQPVMVTHVGGKTKKNDIMVIPRDLPKMLKPGEYLIEYASDLTFVNKELKYLFAIDSFGKQYKFKHRFTKKIIKRVKEMNIQES